MTIWPMFPAVSWYPWSSRILDFDVSTCEPRGTEPLHLLCRAVQDVVAVGQVRDRHRRFAQAVHLHEAGPEFSDRSPEVFRQHRAAAVVEGLQRPEVVPVQCRAFHEALHHGGRGEHIGDPVGLDGRQDPVGIEGDGFRNDVGRRLADVRKRIEAAAVGQRSRVQGHVVGPEALADVRVEVHGHRQQIPVGQQCPFRLVRGTGSVEHPRHVVRSHGQVAERIAFGANRRLVVQHAIPRLRNGDDVPDTRQAVPDPRNRRVEFGGDNDQFGFRMVDYKRVFVGMEAEVDRHGRGACLETREHGFQHFRKVLHEDGHVAARAQPEPEKRVRQPVHAPVEFGVGPSSRAVSQRQILRKRARGFRQQRADVHGLPLLHKKNPQPRRFDPCCGCAGGPMRRGSC